METPLAAVGFALFDTALGACGIAWSTAGIVGVQLPEANVADGRRRLARRFPEARECPPPADVAEVIARIGALLAGGADDLSSVVLDWGTLPDWQRRVYELAREVGPGTTTTYGALAERSGAPGGARAVGQAMGRNPFPIVVPCHRVLAAGGRTGGFSAHGGVATKARLLAIERAVDPDGQSTLEEFRLG